MGNGHLATVVYSDFIYMNGFYNGENGLSANPCFSSVTIRSADLFEGTSHRARIPSTLNWQFKVKPTSSLYTLDVSSGNWVLETDFLELGMMTRCFHRNLGDE